MRSFRRVPSKLKGSPLYVALEGPPARILPGGPPLCVLSRGSADVSCWEGLLYVSGHEGFHMHSVRRAYYITSQRGLPQLNWKGLQYDSCRKDLYVSYRKVKGHLI